MPREPRRPRGHVVAAAEKASMGLPELLSLEENAGRHTEALKRVGALLAAIRRQVPTSEVRELAALIRSDAKLLFRVHGSKEGRARDDLRTQYLRDCARLRTHIGVRSVSLKERR
jgi:hypothetical protein